ASWKRGRPSGSRCAELTQNEPVDRRWRAQVEAPIGCTFEREDLAGRRVDRGVPDEASARRVECEPAQSAVVVLTDEQLAVARRVELTSLAERGTCRGNRCAPEKPRQDAVRAVLVRVQRRLRR